MIPSVVIALLLIAFASLVAWISYRRIQLARRVRKRTFSEQNPSEQGEPTSRMLVGRYQLIVWGAAVSIALIIVGIVKFPWSIGLTIGVITGMLAGQLETFIYTHRLRRLEHQLADSIDLMVGALGAGAGATAALSAAMVETRQPLKSLLQETLTRIQLGDDAQQVFAVLSRRIPIETFLLFTSALAVHWEVGGSLAPTLATLGRTIRDRMEVAQRINSNIAQSQASTVLIIAITYFIALLMWNQNPASVQGFLVSDVGIGMVTISLILQAVGIVWMARISRIRF